jgi:YVTN family beta-propeller protein
VYVTLGFASGRILVSYSLGIDIGTTFVVAGLARASTTQVIPLGNQSIVIPAAVHLRGDGTLMTGTTVGLPAVSSPDRMCRKLMSRLGDPAPVMLGGKPYEPTTVLSILLRDVMQKITKTQGGPPNHIMLTHPPNWGPFRCALFGEAARQGGLVRPGLVTEPEAAVAHYTASRSLNDGETVAVFDLGGGSFNVTILRKHSSGMQILGEPVTFPMLAPARPADVRLAHAMVRDPIQSPTKALSQSLQSAQVKPADLSTVLMVGESSHIPVVAQMVSDELGCPAVVDSDPQYVVALGAARLAAQTAPSHRAVHNGSVLRLQDQPLSIPAQRTPEHDTATPASNTPGEDNTLRENTTGENTTALQDVVTVPTIAPAAKPQSEASPPPAESPRPHDRRRRREIEAIPPVNRRRRPQVLLGTGAAVALTGVITVAVLGGRSGTQSTAPAGTPPAAKPEPTAVAKVGPQTAIPAVGATIQVERSPGFVAISPDGRRAYTANRDAQVVNVVDTTLNRVVTTIPIAAGPPQYLTFSPDGRRLYISLFNDQQTIHAIGVLDTISNTMIVTIPQHGRPYIPAITPDGTRIYVPNHDIAFVSVIDTATNTVIGQIAVPANPHGVEFSPDGRRAYTANHESNVVSVIDTATLAVLKTIPVGISPHSIAVNPRHPLAANTNFDSNSVSAIDTRTSQVVATIPVGNNPQHIAWAPDGRFAYVVNYGSNTVSVIDAATNRVTTTLPTGTGPTSIAVLPDGRRAYISNLDSGTLTILDLPR